MTKSKRESFCLLQQNERDRDRENEKRDKEKSFYFVGKMPKTNQQKTNILSLCKHSYHVAPSDIIVDNNILRKRSIHTRTLYAVCIGIGASTPLPVFTFRQM